MAVRAASESKLRWFLHLADNGSFKSMLQLLRLDWRDVLMAGGLGQDDWRTVLDAELGLSEDSATI
jgi:hypothetical protein